MPPIPASTASRSKLQAFQFRGLPEDSETTNARQPKLPTSCELDKENQNPPEDQEAMASSQLLPSLPPTSQRSHHKECPQTPVGRLPLAELIAGVNDNTNQNLNPTPIERVLWQHVPSNTQYVSSQEASASRTGKKRARSSSPTSSSQNETSIHFPKDKRSFDLQTLERTLKTPQADPAADLWTRYSLKVGDARDGSPSRNATVLADLLKSSSPQTPGSHLKQKELGVLRRSISCANEWPTSAAKRRRLNNTGSQNLALDNCPAVEQRNNARMSRVNLLVEQIQNGFLKERDQNFRAKPSISSSQTSESQDHARSSSPLLVPEVHDNDEQEGEGESALTFVGDKSAIEKLDEPDGPFVGAETSLLDGAGRISDFEDDDFDNDLLEAVDASIAPRHSTGALPSQTTRTLTIAQSKDTNVQMPFGSTAKPEGHIRTTTERAHAGTFTKTVRTRSSSPTKVATVLEDFDEDDNDMSAADLEDLVAVFDKQSPNRKKQSYQMQPQQTLKSKAMQELQGIPAAVTKSKTHTEAGRPGVIDVSSDEDYGDGFDFEDIGADCTEQPRIESQNLSVGT